ncbi:hypothetical protein AB1N83_014266, partial [Pleurotus pulmonarius]
LAVRNEGGVCVCAPDMGAAHEREVCVSGVQFGVGVRMATISTGLRAYTCCEAPSTC